MCSTKIDLKIIIIMLLLYNAKILHQWSNINKWQLWICEIIDYVWVCVVYALCTYMCVRSSIIINTKNYCKCTTSQNSMRMHVSRISRSLAFIFFFFFFCRNSDVHPPARVRFISRVINAFASQIIQTNVIAWGLVRH